MAERPILFSASMVRAILDGREVVDLYRYGFTVSEIGGMYGYSKEPVRRVLREAGESMRPAKQRPGRMVGANNPAWRGGRRVRSDGYVALWTPQGEQLEHRMVAERKMGRKLRRGEVVHHIDEDKQNNHPDNLIVLNQSQHAAIHSPAMHAARYGR